MTGPVPFPKQADTLKLRAKTRPVARLNRKALLTGAGLCILFLFAAASIALDPPRARNDAAPEELYNTTTRRTPEGLTRLPETYAAWSPGPEVPLLGAPQSGDLGGTIVAEEDRWGLTRDWDVAPGHDFRPSPEDEARRAQRLSDAKLADEAGKAGVFFRLSRSRSLADPPEAPSTDRGPASPLALLPASAGRLAAARAEGGGPFWPEIAERQADLADPDVLNRYRVEAPASPFMLMAGSMIPAALVTRIDSDLPGNVIAQVTQPVYDTVSGNHLLIPQGARLLGRYQSDLAYGQNRAMVIWERILFPDGSSLRISEPGTETDGAAGFSDHTDHHWAGVFSAAGLGTLLGIGAELGAQSDDDIVRAVRRGTQETISAAGQRTVDRSLSRKPTVRVRPGWPVRVLVTRDLILTPYERGNME